jgi:hypothetical protein
METPTPKVRRKDWHNIARALRDGSTTSLPIMGQDYLEGLRAGQTQMIIAMKLFCRDNGVAFNEQEWASLLERPNRPYDIF